MTIVSADIDADGVVRAPGLVITNIFKLQEQVLDYGVDMWGAPAKGMPLHTNGNLGVDLVQVQPGDKFPVHTHPGDHLLLCLKGSGTISIGEETYTVNPGDLYMVPGLIPHAVGAPEDDVHVLAAFGSPHMAVDSPGRMTLVDWDGNLVQSAIYAD